MNDKNMNKSQKLAAYYQILASILITAGAVLITAWFTYFIAEEIANENLFRYEGIGMLVAAIGLLSTGIIIPLLGIKKIPES